MKATSRRIRSGEDEHIVLSNGRAQASWGLGAELTLFGQMDNMRVVGGSLLELVDSSRSRRLAVVGMGRDSDEDFAADPEAFQDVLGAGLRARRAFPVAGPRLSAELDIAVYHARPWVVLTLRVANHGPAPVTLNRLFPFVAGHTWDDKSLDLGGNKAQGESDDERPFAVYTQGWQSWSFTGGLPPGVPDARPRLRTAALWHNPGGTSPREPLGGAADVVSNEMVLVGRPGGYPALLAGFLSAERYFGQIYVDRQNGSLSAAMLLDGCVLAPGESVESEPLLLGVGVPDALLETYAEALAQCHSARSSAGSPTGWCSWYYYEARVSEADVLENLGALRTARPIVPLDVVQIDDGYQRAVGDWTTPNERFPSGMAELAARIRDAGFRPGLWLAPFTVAADSRLAQEHPEWLVHGDDGRVQPAGQGWHTTLYALDTSHPGTHEWLRRLLSTVVEQWGYDYLKLDFLVTAAIRGQRWNAATTRAEALRQGLHLIRSTVGDQVYLLGCGCPLWSAIGVVDAMRIGPDVSPQWSAVTGLGTLAPGDAYPSPNTESAIRNALLRAWMHPHLWTNDPDCLLARDSETELTRDEVQALATAVGLTGGMMLISDPVARLPLDRLDLVSRLLPPLRERAVPASYFDVGVPERVVARLERPWGTWWLVGLFNSAAVARELRVTWSDLRLEPGGYHATEFWSGGYLGVSPEGAAVMVGAHGAAVLAVRAQSDDPLLLSTSFHISQGGVEIASWDYERHSERLRWTVELGRHAAGTLTLWVPPALTPRRLVSTARVARWRRNQGGEILVEAEVSGHADFALELERR